MNIDMDTEVTNQADDIASFLTKTLMDGFIKKEGREPNNQEIENLLSELTEERITELMGLEYAKSLVKEEDGPYLDDEEEEDDEEVDTSMDNSIEDIFYNHSKYSNKQVAEMFVNYITLHKLNTECVEALFKLLKDILPTVNWPIDLVNEMLSNKNESFSSNQSRIVPSKRLNSSI